MLRFIIFLSLFLAVTAQTWSQLPNAGQPPSTTPSSGVGVTHGGVGGTDTGGGTKNAASGTAAEISNKGEETWTIDQSGIIYRWDGSNWIQKGTNTGAKIAASPDGSTWMVDSQQDVYQWNKDTSVWTQIPGQKLVQISAQSKTKAIGCDSAGQVWVCNNKVWTKFPGTLPGPVQWCAIGTDGDCWFVCSRSLYHWNPTTNNCDKIPNQQCDTVDCLNKCKVVITCDQQVLTYKSGTFQQLSLASASPGCTRATLSCCRHHVIDTNQCIWRTQCKATGTCKRRTAF